MLLLFILYPYTTCHLLLKLPIANIETILNQSFYASPDTYNFAFAKQKELKIMHHQVLIWSLLIFTLVFIFVVREANKVKKSIGNNKFFEFTDEYTVYSYDEDDC